MAAIWQPGHADVTIQGTTSIRRGSKRWLAAIPVITIALKRAISKMVWSGRRPSGGVLKCSPKPGVADALLSTDRYQETGMQWQRWMFFGDAGADAR